MLTRKDLQRLHFEKKKRNTKVVEGIQTILGFYIYPAVTFSFAVTTLQSLHA